MRSQRWVRADIAAHSLRSCGGQGRHYGAEKFAASGKSGVSILHAATRRKKPCEKLSNHRFRQSAARTELPDPTPTGHEVVVGVKAAGVCHSDLHIWEGGYDLGGGRRLIC